MVKAIIVGRYGEKWVKCPMCGKWQFPITEGAIIRGQQFKCKASWCRALFEVDTNVESQTE